MYKEINISEVYAASGETSQWLKNYRGCEGTKGTREQGQRHKETQECVDVQVCILAENITAITSRDIRAQFLVTTDLTDTAWFFSGY